MQTEEGRATEGLGTELRQRREAAGWPLSRLAEKIHYTKGYLSKVETGKAGADRKLVEAYDAALNASGAITALLDKAVADRSAGPGVLPAMTRYFVGRDDEAARIRSVLLGESPHGAVCVLHGIAGAGKTALALRAGKELANQFPDGSVFLDLSGGSAVPDKTSDAGALNRLLRMTGVPGQDIPQDMGGQADLLRDRLHGQRMLLILDNVLSAGQIAPMLPPEPGCGVLITSRSRLNALDEAAHLLIDALPAAQARELFRHIGGTQASDHDEATARIVDYCGRLPLAVRIAAARFQSCPAWTPADFAARLADEAYRLRALDDGERSVSAALRLSYRDLLADQRRMLGFLALHPGPEIEVRAAAALAGVSLNDADRLLWSLSDAHLITWRSSDRVESHDLVRLFVVEHALPELSDAEADAAIRRLLELVLCQTAACDRLLSPYRFRPSVVSDNHSCPPVEAEAYTSEETALNWLNKEWPSLVELCRIASARGMHEYCWQLAFFLRDYFFRTKLWTPWIDTHRLALESVRLVRDARSTAMTLNNLGMAYADRGQLEDARKNYVEALRLFSSLADEHGAATTRSNLGWINLGLGNFAAALRQLEFALEFYQRDGAARNVMIALRGIALAETELGLLADALRHAEQAKEDGRTLKLELDTVMALNCVAWVHFRASRHEEAVRFYEQAAELGQHIGSRYEVARARTGLGNVAAAMADHAKAAEQWSLAEESMRAIGGHIVGEARARRMLERELPWFRR